MEQLIQLRNVRYDYYGQIAALNGVNLSVNAGDMLAVIGQNGSGKSTLLHLINGLVFSEDGTYLYKGREVNEKWMKDKTFSMELRRNMGYIFQNPDLQLFCPTVWDELLFGPLQLGFAQSVAAERAEAVMESMNITGLKNRNVTMLSGGEKKKVAIAAILTANPGILLVDEPLAGIDPRTQTFFTELILQLHKAGKTIIFTTHHLDLVDHLQPSVAVLGDDHTICRTGKAADILQDESFLASVNLIHEHVHRHGGEEHRHYHSHYVFHKH